MSAHLAIQHTPASAYEAAIEAAVEDLAAARSKADDAEGEAARWRGRCAELEQLIRNLLPLLPADRQTAFKHALAQASRPASSSKGGPLFESVVHLFKKTGTREWKPAEVQRELESSGVRAEPKEVGNVLGYLARTGKIRRIFRGHYLVDGALLTTSEDIVGADFGQVRESENQD